MNSSRDRRSIYKQLSWLLIATMLIGALLPIRYHMHHAADAELSQHGHAVDFHISTELADPAHPVDEPHNIAATPEGLTKQITSPVFSPFLLAVILLSLLPLFLFMVGIQRGYTIIGFKQRYPHFSPPLRAPPAI